MESPPWKAQVIQESAREAQVIHRVLMQALRRDGEMEQPAKNWGGSGDGALQAEGECLGRALADWKYVEAEERPEDGGVWCEGRGRLWRFGGNEQVHELPKLQGLRSFVGPGRNEKMQRLQEVHEVQGFQGFPRLEGLQGLPGLEGLQGFEGGGGFEGFEVGIGVHGGTMERDCAAMCRQRQIRGELEGCLEHHEGRKEEGPRCGKAGTMTLDHDLRSSGARMEVEVGSHLLARSATPPNHAKSRRTPNGPGDTLRLPHSARPNTEQQAQRRHAYRHYLYTAQKPAVKGT